MPKKDFLGVWNVRMTAGTPFGLGTRIAIFDDQGTFAVTFTPELGTELGITYLPESEQVRITGLPLVSPTDGLILARYEHPLVPGDFRALYGVALMDDLDSRGSRRLAACSARYERSVEPDGRRPGAPGRTAACAVGPGDFLGTCHVTAASGSQFGIASRVVIEDGPPLSLSIRNAFGDPLPMSPTMEFDPLTCSLRGVLTDGPMPVVIQCSLAELGEGTDRRRRLFGLAVVGDPENSGVWGGDEEDPPSETRG